MREKTLSVFVDESGRFQHPDDDSPYYIISLVLHDQSQPIDGLAADLDKAFSALRLTNVCFHAGPLIRQKGPFAFMVFPLQDFQLHDGLRKKGEFQVPLPRSGQAVCELPRADGGEFVHRNERLSRFCRGQV